MSQRIKASISCPHCNTQYEAELFRSIWGENAQNKAMVFSDEINRTTCPVCGRISFARTSLLYSNRDLHFAVWFEPVYDSQIDAEYVKYKAVTDRRGPGYSYYFSAPRVADWQEFKELIRKYETRELVTESQLFRENPGPPAQPKLPKMGILKNLFGGSSRKPRIFAASEWKLVVPQLNQDLKEVRVSWYQKCVAELSTVRPGVIRNFSLEREGEFLSDIYQILLAWYFVTANGYIGPNEIPAFAMEMQGHLLAVCGAQKVLDASARYYCDGREKVTDYMTFSHDIALFMVGTTNDYDALLICRSIPCFTKVTYAIAAKCFADQTSVNRLLDDVNEMARQKDVDYVDPSKYQIWKR